MSLFDASQHDEPLDIFGPDIHTTGLPTTKPKEEDLRLPNGVKALKAKAGAPTNHNQRTRNYWQKLGYIYAPCETRDTHWNGQFQEAGHKHDLLGFIDAIAFKEGEIGVIGVQICSTRDHSGHIRKCCSTEIDKKTGRSRVDNLRGWLGAGNRMVVIEWQRREKVGSKEWFEVLHWITEETIALVESRRRKK